MSISLYVFCFKIQTVIVRINNQKISSRYPFWISVLWITIPKSVYWSYGKHPQNIFQNYERQFTFILALIVSNCEEFAASEVVQWQISRSFVIVTLLKSEIEIFEVAKLPCAIITLSESCMVITMIWDEPIVGLSVWLLIPPNGGKLIHEPMLHLRFSFQRKISYINLTWFVMD